MGIVPTKFFLTKGAGVHLKELRAFENALRDAGIQACNLVKISSILPPGCERITKDEGLKLLRPGQITFAVLAQSETNEPGQLVAAGIGMAQLEDRSDYGYLAEAESVIGRTAEDVAQDVTEMALENLVTKWNSSFDGDSVYQAGKKEYQLEGKKICADSIVQTARGAENNQYTVVVTAAIMIY